MASQEEIKGVRLKKIELLKAAKMEAYPAKVPRDFCLRDAKKYFAEYGRDGTAFADERCAQAF